jgi:ubiquinone/menaquinone biosynthesis C-methylase UbiE
MTDLQQLYALRFADIGLDKRRRVWKVLCDDFFNKLIDPENTVLDLACGYGEFINNVRCRHKIAVDMNRDAQAHLNADVEFVESSAGDMQQIANNTIDTVFTSNFLEHLPDKIACDRVLDEIWRVLTPGGQIIVMGPNIKHAFREYWDYYDHILPFSDLSIAEGLRQHGFTLEHVVGRFLPYTMNNSLPTPAIIIKAYLHLPLAWRIFGKQFLVVARKAQQMTATAGFGPI